MLPDEVTHCLVGDTRFIGLSARGYPASQVTCGEKWCTLLTDLIR